MSSTIDILKESSSSSLSGLLIAIAILIVPFIFDNINNASDTFICPHEYNKVYGVIVLVSPALFILAVGISLIFFIQPSQSIINFECNSKKKILDFTKKFLLILLISLIVLGITFIRGTYYSCTVLGPDRTLIITDNYQKDFDSQNSLSQIIGWSIILASALLVVLASVIEKCVEGFNIKNKMMIYFKLELDKERDRLLNDELEKMGDKTVQYLFRNIISANMNNPLNEEGLKIFIKEWSTIRNAFLEDNLSFLKNFGHNNRSYEKDIEL